MLPTVLMRGLAGLLVIAALSGCSSFRSDRRAAQARGTPASGIDGYWVGRWHDLSNPKHGGKLECVLTPVGHHVYRLSSRSQWLKIFTSAYDANVVVTPVAPNQAIVLGGQELWLFGGHSVTGRVDTTKFEATYTVGSHSGRMELHRP